MFRNRCNRNNLPSSVWHHFYKLNTSNEVGKHGLSRWSRFSFLFNSINLFYTPVKNIRTMTYPSLTLGSSLTSETAEGKLVEIIHKRYSLKWKTGFMYQHHTGKRILHSTATQLDPTSHIRPFPCVHLWMHVKTKASLERFGIFCTDLVLCIIFVTYSLNAL